MLKKSGLLAALAIAGMLATPAHASTLSLHSSWVYDGFTTYSWDGSGAINVTATPGSYDFSHTIGAAIAPFVIPGSVYGGNAPLGSEFYDDWVFTVTGSLANAVSSSINLGTLLGISNLSARLYSYTSLPQIGPVGSTLVEAWGTPFSCGAGCTGETVVLPNVVLAPGTYVLEIRGLVSGSVSGSYGGALNLAPVPVPGAVWLLGSALTALGWLRRRSP